nr:hypothetical protein Iba_chr11aCG11030 [Ipomoea batatas]
MKYASNSHFVLQETQNMQLTDGLLLVLPEEQKKSTSSPHLLHHPNPPRCASNHTSSSPPPPCRSHLLPTSRLLTANASTPRSG